MDVGNDIPTISAAFAETANGVYAKAKAADAKYMDQLEYTSTRNTIYTDAKNAKYNTLMGSDTAAAQADTDYAACDKAREDAENAEREALKNSLTDTTLYDQAKAAGKTEDEALQAAGLDISSVARKGAEAYKSAAQTAADNAGTAALANAGYAKSFADADKYGIEISFGGDKFTYDSAADFKNKVRTDAANLSDSKYKKASFERFQKSLTFSLNAHGFTNITRNVESRSTRNERSTLKTEIREKKRLTFEPVEWFGIQHSDDLPDRTLICKYNNTSRGLGLRSFNVLTEDQATHSIDHAKNALARLSAHRAAYGAFQNRLEHTYNSRANMEENTQAAETRIRDTDMAEEMERYSKNNILAQAGQAVLAQANNSTQGVLTLLQ